jgi:hypothetical protein
VPRICAREGCGQTIPAKNLKYCDNTCARAEQQRRYRAERGGSTEPVYGKGRALCAYRCRNGHERTPENTTRGSKGERRCLICARAAWRRAAAKKREKAKVAA